MARLEDVVLAFEVERGTVDVEEELAADVGVDEVVTGAVDEVDDALEDEVIGITVLETEVSPPLAGENATYLPTPAATTTIATITTTIIPVTAVREFILTHSFSFARSNI